MIRSQQVLTAAPRAKAGDHRIAEEARLDAPTLECGTNTVLRAAKVDDDRRAGRGHPRWELLRAWMALPFFTAFVACASSPPPTARMASAQATVRVAHEVGAENVPEAKLHVKLAEEQIQRARSLIDTGDNRRADLMLQRANADAELGVALAREDATREQAQRIIDQTRDLRMRNSQPEGQQPDER